MIKLSLKKLSDKIIDWSFEEYRQDKKFDLNKINIKQLRLVINDIVTGQECVTVHLIYVLHITPFCISFVYKKSEFNTALQDFLILKKMMEKNWSK